MFHPSRARRRRQIFCVFPDKEIAFFPMKKSGFSRSRNQHFPDQEFVFSPYQEIIIFISRIPVFRATRPPAPDSVFPQWSPPQSWPAPTLEQIRTFSITKLCLPSTKKNVFRTKKNTFFPIKKSRFS